jgi:CDP-diglyceride synthetase
MWIVSPGKTWEIFIGANLFSIMDIYILSLVDEICNFCKNKKWLKSKVNKWDESNFQSPVRMNCTHNLYRRKVEFVHICSLLSHVFISLLKNEESGNVGLGKRSYIFISYSELVEIYLNCLYGRTYAV